MKMKGMQIPANRSRGPREKMKLMLLATLSKSRFMHTLLAILLVFWFRNIAKLQTDDSDILGPSPKTELERKRERGGGSNSFERRKPEPGRRVFVNFSFCHTGLDRLENLKFFLDHGVTNPNPRESDGLVIEYGLVVNGECNDDVCRERSLVRNNDNETIPIRYIQRNNTGFDFGQHTAMLEELDQMNKSYDAYIFLNAGVTGPFIPSYMPSGWHWVNAFIDKLTGDVGVVGTCIVCLPKKDEGGYGPKVEAFAFAMTQKSLNIVRKYGTSFRQHKNKKRAILDGEYALSKTIFEHNMTIDSLQMAYKNVKWNSKMSCNNLKHPSRLGSYFGTEVHPLETIFHKNKWGGKPDVMPEAKLKTYKEFVYGAHRPSIDANN